MSTTYNFEATGYLQRTPSPGTKRRSMKFYGTMTPEPHKTHHHSTKKVTGIVENDEKNVRDIWEAYRSATDKAEKAQRNERVAERLYEDSQDKHRQITKNLNTITEELRHCQLVNETLSQELSKTQMSNQHRIDELQNRLTEKDTLLSHYRQGAKSFEDRIVALTAELHQVRKENEHKQHEISSLRNDLSTELTSRQHDHSLVERLIREKNEIKTEFEDAQRQYSSTLSKYQIELADTADRLKKLQTVVRRYHDRLPKDQRDMDFDFGEMTSSTAATADNVGSYQFTKSKTYTRPSTAPRSEVFTVTAELEWPTRSSSHKSKSKRTARFTKAFESDSDW